MGEEMTRVGWRKAISEERDRAQSRVLVWIVGGLLALESLSALWWMCKGLGVRDTVFGLSDVKILTVSVVFALIVLGLRAATPSAAAFGGIICLVLLWGTASVEYGVVRSGLAPLVLLFLLTFVSTQAGRRIKAKAGLAEKRRGRNAAQVIANLAVAALSVANLGQVLVVGGLTCCRGNYYTRWVYPATMMMCLAALVEATADTVSSEIGQAFGGRPVMLISMRRVDPGADGGVTLLGSVAGIAGGAFVAAIGMWALRLSASQAAIALFAGICGLFFDSFLGATVERRGWIGNDLVNFSSTVFAAALAAGIYRYLVM